MKKNKLKSIITAFSFVIGLTLISSIPSSAAWKQDSNGWWNTEGSSYSTGWRNIDNAWYFFGDDGYMKTGWITDNGTWYYLNSSGAMQTGWVKSNNIWYYLDQSGAMKTGWVKNNETWYYTNANGEMQTGLLSINNNTYYFNESGAMVTGDITLNGVKYTFAKTGEKIESAQTKDTDAAKKENSTSNTESSTGSTSSGGSSGSSSSSKKDNTKFKGYSDLYGTWTVDSHIENSGMKDSIAALSAFVESKSFTVEKNTIKSRFGNASDVSTSEKILTNSQFKDKFGTDISKLGLSGDKVNCISVSANGKHADIIVSSNDEVVAIANKTPFKLEKN